MFWKTLNEKLVKAGINDGVLLEAVHSKLAGTAILDCEQAMRRRHVQLNVLNEVLHALQEHATTVQAVDE